jgi:pilus assembly protein CpaC
MSLLRAAAIAFVLAILSASAFAATPNAMAIVEAGQTLAIESGSGRVVTLRGSAANVFVANPKIAEVRPASANALFIFGISPGRTTVAALDAAGVTVANYEVVVSQSGFAASEAERAVSHLLPGSRFRVQAGPKGLLVSGDAGSPAEAARALAIARTYLTEGQSVEDQISLGSSTQVMLRVRIAEMSRTVTRALGINWQALGKLGSFATTSAFTLGNPVGRLKLGTTDFNSVIDALASDDLARILAEPNLTAMSGQPASFLAGGEFPVPVAVQNGEVTIEFKRYGVNLSFVPTVLNSGRINLHVSPEVSELTQTGAIQIGNGNAIFSIPALTVRRAETSVELGSGESFAVAGLLQDNTTQNVSGLPGLGDVPVLGALFRSNEFQRKETELVILVTPYIVNPATDPQSLHMPGEAYQAPSDLERILRQRQAAAGTTGAATRIPGHAGFIVQ